MSSESLGVRRGREIYLHYTALLLFEYCKTTYVYCLKKLKYKKYEV